MKHRQLNMYAEIAGMGQAAESQALNVPALNKGTRAEIMAFMQSPEFPKDVKEQLANRKLKFADHVVYNTKIVNGRTIKMFEPQDSKEIAISNLDRGRLPKNMVMVVSSIRILAAYLTTTAVGGYTEDLAYEDAKFAKFYGIDHGFPLAAQVGADGGGNVAMFLEGDTASATNYGAVIAQVDGFQPFSGLENGEFTLTVNRKDVVDEVPMSVFKKNGLLFVREGEYKLDNPRLIQDDVEIELDIDLGAEVLADNWAGGEAVAIRVELIGSATIPA